MIKSKPTIDELWHRIRYLEAEMSKQKQLTEPLLKMHQQRGFTKKETAAILGVHPNTVSRWVKEGTLKLNWTTGNVDANSVLETKTKVMK